MKISIVVPARNSARELPRCLSAFPDGSPDLLEVIVVDDGSEDDTAGTAGRLGARVITLPARAGPAAARNHGARIARGTILFFVDADVVVGPGAVERVAGAFEADPGLAAVFGSYDSHPDAPGLVSQYRNLLHHFVHQRGRPEASTFWAGCGAIRREVFEASGGFDAARFSRPSVEDIDLGMRLCRAGHRIRLDRGLQATHLKRWTFRSMLVTDFARRAIPWSRLILEAGRVPDDLNVRRSERASVALVTLAASLLPLSPGRPGLAALSAVLLLAVVLLNRDLFGFLARQRGLAFAAACVPLHLAHYLGSGLAFGGVWLATWLGRANGARVLRWGRS